MTSNILSPNVVRAVVSDYDEVASHPLLSDFNYDGQSVREREDRSPRSNRIRQVTQPRGNIRLSDMSMNEVERLLRRDR